MRKKTVCLILFALLFVSTLFVAAHIPQVKAWNGTVTIYSDGSVDPPSAPVHPNGDVYTLTDNIATTGDGIIIERNSTTLEGNDYTIQGNFGGNGIDMSQTSYVTVKNTNIQGFYIGIFAPKSEYDTILGNTIAQNSYLGIWLDGSSNDNIIGNNIQQNSVYGIWLTSSSNNNIYHNNFINNAAQVYTDSINTWDAGYPEGGNYWSDYTGSDLYGGPFQNVTGSDGIGDAPYVLDSNNADNYPLISTLVHDVGITDVSAPKTVVGQGYAVNLSVQVVNYGLQQETFNVAIYSGSVMIHTWPVTLAGQTSETLTYAWNTSGNPKGNYTLSAYASPVQNENLITDNSFTDGFIIVTILGDVTGGTRNPWDFVPDGKVDGKDIAIVAVCFGSAPGCSPPYVWNANCDVNNDGKVDGKDIALVAIHFGQAG